jgi:oligopeptidase A
MNPLLDFSGLPRFAEIQPEHVTPAIEHLLGANRALLERLLADPAEPDWDGFVLPLEDANEHLSRAWGQVSHLHSVADAPELREAYNANLPRITEYYADLGQNAPLFRKFKAVRARADFPTLSEARRKVIDNELRDFRLGGAELPDDKKARFKAIQEELAGLGAKFEENLLDATNAWSKLIADPAQLAGVPEDVLGMLREAAEADGQTGYKLSLRAPSYMPIMQFCANRALREEMYRAYVTRASEFGPANLDNTALIARIVELRREAARLLGFDNYAEVSLEPKMARTPAEVLDFLETLARRAKPYAEKDMAELRAYAAAELGLDEMRAWDVGYASEKLREARYAFSEQEVKTYFQEPKVLAGLFKLVETLYGLRIRETQAPVWHEDVKFYAIEDGRGQPVGRFYLDLYARESKRGGAWMDDAITRRRKHSGIQEPVAYLNCNFARPSGGKPALFTHDDVITLFHEFGHGLHHLLTRVDEASVSGIRGVAWDAVELPSQFMENWAYDRATLNGFARHWQTGAEIPDALLAKLQAGRGFQAGMQTLRQIELSLFDLRLHRDTADGVSILDRLAATRAEVSVFPPPEWNRMPNSFGHIFAGGYAAGYYSYKWAEVLSADAFAAFEESDFAPETGRRFRDTVLANGGSQDAMDLFVAFRGRKPEVDALLRHSGLTA